VWAGGIAWTAYDTYKAYQDGGAAGALKSLAVDGVIAVVTGGAMKLGGKIVKPLAKGAWQYGTKVFPSAEKALEAILSENKLLGKIFNKFASRSETKIAQKAVQQEVNVVTQKVEKAVAKDTTQVALNESVKVGEGAVGESVGKELAKPTVEVATQLEFDFVNDIVKDVGKTEVGAAKSVEKLLTSNELKALETSAPLKQGGSYGELRKVHKGSGKESHHMPSDFSSPLPKNDGPAIMMEKVDHSITKTWGRGQLQDTYRQMQKDMLENGQWRQALSKDVWDVKNKFGTKYNEGLHEMLEYAKTLEQFKKP